MLIAGGTDFGGGSLRANQLAWEIECLVTAGPEPSQALAAATRDGGVLLGEPEAGVIRDGGLRPGARRSAVGSGGDVARALAGRVSVHRGRIRP